MVPSEGLQKALFGSLLTIMKTTIKMNQIKNNLNLLSIILLLSFVIISCANPFGKGTWRPLPLKKWQNDKLTTIPSQDSSRTYKKKQ